MTRQIIGFASAALFAVSVSTAWAQPQSPQDPTGGRVGGGSTGGGDTSPASPATTSSGSSSSDSGAATPTSSGGGSSSAVSSSSSWGEGRTIEGPRMAAPRRGSSYSEDGGGQRERAVPRGGGSSGERATPRGGSSDRSSGDGGGARERAVPRGEGSRIGGRTGAAATPPVDDQPGRNRGAVPAYSRPRDGRVVVGTPVERTEATRVRGGGSAWYYDPYWSGGFGYGYSGYGYGYRPYRAYGYPGYGFGLGYFYDPFMFGSVWGDPYYGGGGYYGGYYGGGGAGYYQGRGYDTGSLRLKIRPADAKVYVDGYFVGVVDSFDGVFQKLAVEAGTHRVEIRADGFEPAQFEVMITPGETVTYKGDLKRIMP